MSLKPHPIQSVPEATAAAAEQKRGAARPPSVPGGRESGPPAAPSWRGARPSGQLPESGHQCRHCIEYRLHGRGGRAAQARRLSARRDRSRAYLADAVRPPQYPWEVSFQRGGDSWAARLTATPTAGPEGLAYKISPILWGSLSSCWPSDLRQQGIPVGQPPSLFIPASTTSRHAQVVHVSSEKPMRWRSPGFPSKSSLSYPLRMNF